MKWLSYIGLQRLERIVEFGVRKMALIIAKMFEMDCAVADINEDYRKPIDQAGLHFVIGDLSKDPPISNCNKKYDFVIIFEAIERLPDPADVVFNWVKYLLNDRGKIL